MRANHFLIWIDGASRHNPGESSAAGIVKKSSRTIAKWCLRLGIYTNNQAEYFAFILSLLWLKQHPYQTATIYTDSQLLAEQIIGNWKVRSKELLPLHHVAITLLTNLHFVTIVHIPRIQNRIADKLANFALDHQDEIDESLRKEFLQLLSRYGIKNQLFKNND
ncbi:MAG: ribonuclease HI family protein [bacterium]|nr:ribonuclease HI family protein [bacterium]